MKKRAGFLLAMMSVFTLTACGSKPTANITNESIGRSTFKFDLEVIDDKEEVTAGSVSVKFYEITDDGDQLYTTKTVSGLTGTVSVTGLSSSTNYRADVSCTYDKKSQIIYSWNFTTKSTGTESDPIIISDAQTFIDTVSSDYSSDAYYKLGADLDFSSIVDFKGICETSTTAFCGQIDGDGHSIKNVTISADTAYNGLFGYLKGTLRNITFENVNVTASRTSQTTTYTGAICGYAYQAKLIDVTVKNPKIDVTANSQYTGGAIGYSFASSVRGCNVTGADIKAKKGSTTYVGGFTGYVCQNSNSKYGTINNTSVDGAITVDGASTVYAGGFVGYAKVGSQIHQGIANVAMDVKAYGSTNIGGFIGSANAGTYEGDRSELFSNIVASGSINFQSYKNDERAEATEDILIGGVIGSATAIELDSVYANVNITADVKMAAEKGIYTGAIYGRGYEYHTTATNTLINSTIAVTTTDSDANAKAPAVYPFDGSSYKELTDIKCYSDINAKWITANISVDSVDAGSLTGGLTLNDQIVDEFNWDMNIWDVKVENSKLVINFK